MQTTESTQNSSRRKQKHYETVNYVQFANAVRDLNLTEAQLLKAIGYGHTAASSWKLKNRMPKTAALAIEALRRRNGAGHQERATHSRRVIAIPTNNQEAVLTVLESLGCKVSDELDV